MKIDLTCPAELWRYELPKEDYRACELILFNLSDKVITSVEVTLILSNKDGDEQTRLTYRAHDLQGAPAKTFGVSVPMDTEEHPAALEVVVDKVWFGDASIWRCGKGPMTEYTSNALPNSRSLEQLRYAAGPTAVGFPQEQDGLWLCVCGRPNADYAKYCIRCQREKKEVFEQFSKENVEKLAAQREKQLSLKGKAAREEASRLQLQREAEFEVQRKKRRKVRIAVSAVAGVALLTYAGVFHLAPYLRYRQAVTYMEEGRYAVAQAAFAEMGSYMEAEEYILRCRYLSAQNLLTSNDPDTLSAAREELAVLGEFEDAPALIQQADYRRAGLLLAAGNVEGASALFASLGDYEDSPAKVTYCAYLTADELLESGKLAEARSAFEALGDYEDAAAKAQQAIYLSGKAALDAGELDSALALLEQAASYGDAQTLIQQVYYLQAANLRGQGELQLAGEKFLLAGDYQDAAEEASACFYTLADGLMQDGAYAQAAEKFAAITGYQDAADRRNACLYTLAQGSINDLEFNMAKEYLAQLPDDYENVAALRQECFYQPGIRAMDKKDYQTAVEQLSQVPGYQDADKQLQKARYRLAEEKMTAKDYAAAIAQYELLGDYSDSEKQLRSARYLQANLLFTNEDYAGAEALYTLIADYKDVAARLDEIHFIQADALLSAGDYAAARPVFAALENHAQAQEKVKTCDMLYAAALQEQGSLLEAAQLYASLGEFEDAPAKAQAAYYTLAQQASGMDAAAYYELAGDYQDAAQQADAIYDERYQTLAQQADEAMSNSEYALAFTLLDKADLTDLPAKYAHLAETRQEAAYQEAERLTAAGQPFAALPYYQAVPDYKEAAQRLTSPCYQLIGTWQDENGAVYTFNTDGTCTLAGEKLCFTISGDTISTGTGKDELLVSHRVSSLKESSLTLYDLRLTSAKAIKLTRMEQIDLPAQEQTGVAVVDE